MSSLTNRSKKAQKNAIDYALEEILVWYGGASGGKLPEQIYEDKRSYGGKVLRWCHPPVLGVENPVLVESDVGGWTLQIVLVDGMKL